MDPGKGHRCERQIWTQLARRWKQKQRAPSPDFGGFPRWVGFRLQTETMPPPRPAEFLSTGRGRLVPRPERPPEGAAAGAPQKNPADVATNASVAP